MNCDELADLLHDFVAGELSPEQRQHFEQHLCRCPPCGYFYQSYTVTIHLTRKLPTLAPPSGLLDRLLASLERGQGDEEMMA